MRITAISLAVTLALALSCATPAQSGPSAIKGDEEVILFNTSGRLAENGSAWIIPVHGWIFEPEKDSVWRSAVINELVETLEIDPVSASGDIFKRRASMFLVDNERGKKLAVTIGGRVFEMEESGPNGNFEGVARVGRDRAGEVGTWITLEAASVGPPGRTFTGAARLIGPVGISVISDIDDTIKISGVRDKKTLLANTFLRPFEAVEGMVELYRRLAGRGAVFHYVSASPWQLYPSLTGFLSSEGFPTGDLYLRTFRLKDGSFFDFVRSSEDYKFKTIESLMRAYPNRRFILVGDSTESDPEVYGRIAGEHPGQTARVLIRMVPPADEGSARFEKAFAGLPADKWTVFYDPVELAGFDPGAK